MQYNTQMWPSLDKPPICRTLSTLNTPSENTFIADQNGTFIFSIGLSCAKLWAFECEQYTTWFRLHVVLLMCVNSERVGLLVRYIDEQCMHTRISCYKAEVLRVRLLWTLEVAHTIEVRRIHYWTLNTRNVNSMFAVNGWFIQSRSQIWKLYLTSYWHCKSGTRNV